MAADADMRDRLRIWHYRVPGHVSDCFTAGVNCAEQWRWLLNEVYYYRVDLNLWGDEVKLALQSLNVGDGG